MKSSKVVIIGAGFAGLAIARKLAKKNTDILIIDKNNFHTFQPLLYQVATGGLEAESIAYPVRRIFRGHANVRFRMTEVNKIDNEACTLSTPIGEINYEYLIIATGSENNFFDFEKIKDRLLPLKTINDSLNIKSFVIQNLEKVLSAKTESERLALMNIAIIGAGPTGLELAGALAEMKKKVLPKDYPEFDFSRMQIFLFEASERVLTSMSESASKESLNYLLKLGVSVKLNARVKDYDGHIIYLEDGQKFLSDTLIWTAGVKGAPVEGLKDALIVKGNRISVDKFNRVLNCTNVFAVGDVAALISDENPQGHPMLAQVAMQQGKNLAQNLIREFNGKEMKPFHYKNKGVMATIGRNKAVADLPNMKLHGTIAWIIWSFVHLLSLIGFRNKIVTFINWTVNYFNYDRPLGAIIRKFRKS